MQNNFSCSELLVCEQPWNSELYRRFRVEGKVKLEGKRKKTISSELLGSETKVRMQMVGIGTPHTPNNQNSVILSFSQIEFLDHSFPWIMRSMDNGQFDKTLTGEYGE